MRAEGFGSSPEKERLLEYLFLSFAYQLKSNLAEAILQEPVWSDPETTFSILMYRADGVAHDYCCSCIKALGSEWRRECGTTTTAYCKSGVEQNKVQNQFMVLLAEAQERLAELIDKTPQEYFFLKTQPLVKKLYSTDSKHFVILQAEVQDAVDMLCIEETMQRWADYDRIRDYFEISVRDNGMAKIRMVFYRIRKQKQFVRYFEKLGI